jgi:hypothetical protein
LFFTHSLVPQDFDPITSPAWIQTLGLLPSWFSLYDRNFFQKAFFETRSCSVTQTSLKSVILLPSKWLDYKYAQTLHRYFPKHRGPGHQTSQVS